METLKTEPLDTAKVDAIIKQYDAASDAIKTLPLATLSGPDLWAFMERTQASMLKKEHPLTRRVKKELIERLLKTNIIPNNWGPALRNIITVANDTQFPRILWIAIDMTSYSGEFPGMYQSQVAKHAANFSCVPKTVSSVSTVALMIDCQKFLIEGVQQKPVATEIKDVQTETGGLAKGV